MSISLLENFWLYEDNKKNDLVFDVELYYDLPITRLLWRDNLTAWIMRTNFINFYFNIRNAENLKTYQTNYVNFSSACKMLYVVCKIEY